MSIYKHTHIYIHIYIYIYIYMYVSTDGSFRQVSVGSLGVCAIYSGERADVGKEAGVMKCWGFVNNFIEPVGTLWDQVAVGMHE
jgi:hypothetical protein